MTGRIAGMAFSMDGELFLSLTVPRVHAEEMQKLTGMDLDIEIRKHRNKRSRDANAICWATCHEIGVAMKLPKEEVYRKAIKDIGVFDTLRCRDGAVESLIERWGRQGIGWIAEDMGESDAPGYRDVFVYYGSSVYNTAEMSRLIDYLVDEAEQIGITLRVSAREIAEAKRRWGADA